MIKKLWKIELRPRALKDMKLLPLKVQENIFFYLEERLVLERILVHLEKLCVETKQRCGDLELVIIVSLLRFRTGFV